MLYHALIKLSLFRQLDPIYVRAQSGIVHNDVITVNPFFIKESFI